MVSVGSLPVSGNIVFDFDSQTGVMHLLASIRQSDITSQQKSELRDLVFLYTNGGKDQTVRISLEQKIAAYRVTPAPIKKPTQHTPPPPTLTIGKYRVAPSFNTAQPTEVATAPAPKATTIPVFTTTPAWAPKEEAQGQVASQVVEQVAPQPMPVPMPEPVPPPAPAQQPVVAEMPEPVVASPVTTEPPAVAADANQYLSRIREIKAAVNEKVGNPVNLVDINNEVGREYMGALLDAMKKLNSGSSAGSAMKRLEDSYASVLKALDEYEAKGGDASESVVPAPVALDSTPEPVPVVPEEVFVAPLPTPEPIEHIPEPEPEFVPVAPVANYVPINHVQQDEEPTPAPKPVFSAPAPPPPPEWSNPPAVETLGRPATPPPQQQAFVPLSDLKKPHTLEDLQSAASLKVAAEASSDPLFTKEVDDGLNQLLGEWSIFKKSGLFGTGPKGKEHPLFKKIAPLHIPLLLAGRFEGATQEIKQSITDYMNGWRYEQGIIYQQGETFEHYLRRVIRHIIDLQKAK